MSRRPHAIVALSLSAVLFAVSALGCDRTIREVRTPSPAPETARTLALSPD